MFFKFRSCVTAKWTQDQPVSTQTAVARASRLLPTLTEDINGECIIKEHKKKGPLVKKSSDNKEEIMSTQVQIGG